MNNPGLFVAGVLVTVLVVGALSLLIYGAILDGRDEKAASGRPTAQSDTPDPAVPLMGRPDSERRHGAAARGRRPSSSSA